MKRRTIILMSAVPLVLLVGEGLMSKEIGILPFTSQGPIGNKFNVGALTRDAAKSCGQCHMNQHRGVTVTVKPTTRTVLAGQTTAITISGTSTVNPTQSTGGFTADVTSGTLIPGASTRIDTAGKAITHRGRRNRSWTFNWKAPTAPGLTELYTVVNCANNDQPVALRVGDSWGFHGASTTAVKSTPVRLYTNAATGVKPTGESCPDGFGNYSVLGAKTVPTRGATLILEAFGMAPSAPMLIMFSIGGNVPPFDLKPLGAPSCLLRTTIQIEAVVATGGGDASRGEGSFTLPIPIPANTPKGLVFAAQFGFIDTNSKRAFPFTLTNGVECTVQ
jgi:hypothetical protein